MSVYTKLRAVYNVGVRVIEVAIGIADGRARVRNCAKKKILFCLLHARARSCSVVVWRLSWPGWPGTTGTAHAGCELLHLPKQTLAQPPPRGPDGEQPL